MEGRVNRYIEDSFEKIASSYSQGVIQNEIAAVNIKVLQNNKMVDKKISEDELYRMFMKKVNYSKISTFSDGSASLMMCSNKVTKKYKLTPICKIRSIYNSCRVYNNSSDSNSATNGDIDGIVSDIGECVKEYRENNVDIFEILDQNVLIPILVSKSSGIDLSRVNLQGGTIAIGHALGATGLRQIINVITSLKMKNLRFGLVVGNNLIGDSIGILIENCI
ncbi:acetyl-CoA C-acetyltransferase [Theileria orientalis]|uniref:Acetyl-CoA C-acetyltransferase n=1 Tax=Theileria orientalis TaxID=68886 RepID=A0A976M9Y9_THEOR|nr:acetyl-CoA C-acetyltransferase [Theileria orientalis]